MEEAKLKPKQIKCIELIVTHPDYSNTKLGEEVGVNRNTVSTWKRNEDFQIALKKRLQEVWKSGEAIAIRTMQNLAKEGNFHAAKYILDSMDYAPTQRIEADITKDIEITITE